MTAPGVLMVTGAYWPELSGGGLQCRTMIQALRNHIRFRVFTTCTDASLAADAVIDETPVTRVFVDVGRPLTKIRAALATVGFFFARQSSFQVVHLHGFSQKSILIALLARLFGKKVVITIHTAGSDEPQGVRRLGRLAYWCYSGADRFIAVSDRIAQNYRDAGLPPERLSVVANGVDTSRFSPAGAPERAAIRRGIGGLPTEMPWILFVGFFSSDKRPGVLFEAWVRLLEAKPNSSGLMFVGATQSAYHEVDASLAACIRAEADRLGVSHLVHFAGEVADVERFYKAADLFVMPSTREAFGMVLVEAMASGLAVVATRIPGVTDTIVEDGVTGVLVPGEDAAALEAAMAALLADRPAGTEMGSRARASVIARYGLAASTQRWLDVYRQVATCR